MTATFRLDLQLNGGRNLKALIGNDHHKQVNQHSGGTAGPPFHCIFMNGGKKEISMSFTDHLLEAFRK